MFKLMGRIQNWVLAVAGFATAGLFGISVTDIRGCMNQTPKAAVSADLRIEIDRKLKLSGLLTGRSPSGDRWEEAIAQYASSLQKARAEGLDVSNHELGQALMGQFKTKEQYLQFASQINKVHGVKTNEIEEFYRDQILIQKSMNLPLLVAYVTNNEVKDEFHRREDKLTYDKVLVDVNSIKLETELTEEEKKSYFEEVSLDAAYQVDPQVKIDYLFVNPQDMDVAKLTESDLQAYYNENRDRYASTEFPGEAQPYFEVAKEVATALEKESRDNAAKVLLSQLDDILLQDETLNFSAALSAVQAKDATFKKVAYGTSEAFAQKDYRVEPLGYVFNLGTRLFGDNPRNYGGVLEAGNGFYLYKIVENIEGRSETYEEALTKVTAALTLKKKQDLAQVKATELKATLEASKDWTALKLEEGVTYSREEVTGMMSADASKVAALEEGAVSEAYQTNEAFALVKKVGLVAADESLMEATKEQLKEGILRQKAQSIQFARFTQVQTPKLE